MSAQQLAGKRVLVVEDEIFIALDLADSLAEAGAEIVGPCLSLEDAERAARDADIDIAILDVDLGGREVFSAADLLVSRGIPFVFYTGRLERLKLASDFADAPICTKPIAMSRLIETLRGLPRVAA